MYELIIFDLDGTLLDTIADLASATNHALQLLGFPGHEVERYRFFVGNGIDKLFERALPEGARTRENVLKVREAFLPYYEAHNADRTVPYPGIETLLEALQREGLRLAVASNKYNAATKKLAARYFPGIEFAMVLGQRIRVAPKPAPAIVNDILHSTHTVRARALFVGDSGVDMQTAANAGIDAVGVTWGFRPRGELERYRPKYIVDDPAGILEIARR
ncbi:MAG: HAD family hydrolase [Alistipes sp.]|nr:HAD family hydrolase [Alistipes sp.]